MPEEVGLRVYSVDYLKELLRSKCGKVGIPWFVAKTYLEAIPQELQDDHLFVAEILDGANFAIVTSAESFAQKIELNVLGVTVGNKYTLKGDKDHAIWILPSGQVRELFKSKVEARGTKWFTVEDYVVKLAQCFVDDHLVFLRADPENAKALAAS